MSDPGQGGATRARTQVTRAASAPGRPPSSEVLSDDEIIRLITIAARDLGIREVRFTGGEPLLRKGLERIVPTTSRLRLAGGGTPETSLTTNGLGLVRAGTDDVGLANAWSRAMWATGSSDVTIDGTVVKAEERRTSGVDANAAMWTDPTRTQPRPDWGGTQARAAARTG